MNNENTYKDNLEHLAWTIKEQYLDDCFDGDLQDVIHECIDNALIYYSAQYYVMEHTRNEDAYFDHVGTLDGIESYRQVVSTCAYYALYEDVQEYIDYERLEKIKEYLQERLERVA